MPAERRFPIPTWKPRSGRNANHIDWVRAVTQLLSAFGVDWSFIAVAPPRALEWIHNSMDLRSGTINKLSPEEKDELDLAVRWQQLNTALYWHIVPSIDLSGASQQCDTRHIDSLVHATRK